MKNKFFFSLVLTAGSLLISGCTIKVNDTNVNSAINSLLSSAESKLDLSNKQLAKVPNYVFDSINLEELNLANNQLTGAVPAEISHLKNLKVLNLSNNLMTGIPAEVGQLQNLQVLDLSNNQLTGLPYELGNLQNLKTLNISGNNYSTLDLEVIIKNLSTDVQIIK